MTGLAAPADCAAPAVPGQIDPRELTATQMAALRLIATHRFWPGKAGGWRGGGATISRATASHLFAMRLVLRRVQRSGPTLVLSGTGHNTLAVAQQRREKRA